MANIIVSIVIIGAAIGFAWYYMNQSEERRSADRERKDREEARERSFAAGLAEGDRPLWDPNDSDPELRKIFDDGDAHNSKHITPAFRAAFWDKIEEGQGWANAILHAMSVTCWRADSQEQVFERLKSHGYLSEGEANRLKAEAYVLRPAGHGRYSGPGCKV